MEGFRGQGVGGLNAYLVSLSLQMAANLKRDTFGTTLRWWEAVNQVNQVSHGIIGAGWLASPCGSAARRIATGA
jgi:hypothetical protein